MATKKSKSTKTTPKKPAAKPAAKAAPRSRKDPPGVEVLTPEETTKREEQKAKAGENATSLIASGITKDADYKQLPESAHLVPNSPLKSGKRGSGVAAAPPAEDGTITAMREALIEQANMIEQLKAELAEQSENNGYGRTRDMGDDDPGVELVVTTDILEAGSDPTDLPPGQYVDGTYGFKFRVHARPKYNKHMADVAVGFASTVLHDLAVGAYEPGMGDKLLKSIKDLQKGEIVRDALFELDMEVLEPLLQALIKELKADEGK